MLAGQQQVMKTLDSWKGLHPQLLDLAQWGAGTKRYLLESPAEKPNPEKPADYLNLTGQPGRTVSLTPREAGDRIRFQAPTIGDVTDIDGVFEDGRYIWIRADHPNAHIAIEAALRQ